MNIPSADVDTNVERLPVPMLLFISLFFLDRDKPCSYIMFGLSFLNGAFFQSRHRDLHFNIGI
jgi:hypothetical protein